MSWGMYFWKQKNFYYPLTIWLIVVLWYYTFTYKSFNIASLKFQNYISSTAFYMFSRTPPKMDEIVIVAIDEASRRHLNRKWPWPRSVTARLIQNIAQSSPKAIGVDTLFSGASKKSEDEELAAVLKNSQGVVLAYTLERKTNELPLSQLISGKGSIGFVNKIKDKTGAVTKARAFYIDRDGNKYAPDGSVLPQEPDALTCEKADSARVFYAAWKEARENKEYLKLKKSHRSKHEKRDNVN
jgi:CHASE2 domain-containing sensor protein